MIFAPQSPGPLLSPALLPASAPTPVLWRSYGSTIVCWLVIVAFVGFSAWAQARRARLVEISAASSTSAPNLQLNVAGRAAVGEMELLANDKSPTGSANRDRLRKQFQENITRLALSPLDKLKAVVMTRELQGPQAALRQLDEDAPILALHPELTPSTAALRALYTEGSPALTQQARDQLAAQLDWFGQLAITQGQPEASPQRTAVISKAKHTMLVLIGFGSALVVALFLGFLLLILLIVLFSLGHARLKLQPAFRFDKPVFLEIFALWCLMFVLLSLAMSRWKTGHSLLLQELAYLAGSILVALWPLCRGYTFTQIRQSLGWYRGAGIVVEMGCGALGYLAGLPLIAAGFCIMLILSKIAHATPSHPIGEEFSGPMSFTKILSLLIVVSVAAPILEETIFRGALYFHLRRRWHVAIAAVMVAFIFAAIHPQGWTAIPLLGAIAIVLAMLREWRGSLLASITAHGINNAIALLLGILVMN
jgi:membrane protease YdiL (CAAX protease family)